MKTKSVQIDSECTLMFKIFARNIEIISTIPLEESKEDRKVLAIKYIDLFNIEVDKIITVDKQPYKVNEISLLKDNHYNLSIYKLTKSSIFIMPFLGYDRAYFKWDVNFCNCYIGTENDATYGNNIFLLYRFIGDVWFTDFEQELKNSPYFIDSEDVDKAHVLYEFLIPPEYTEDLNLILEGKYSQLSVKAKNRIITFSQTGENKPLFKILNKSQDYRKELEEKLQVSIPQDNELHDKFVEEEEIYLNKYRINS